MGRKFDWSKVQRAERLISMGAETVGGRVINRVEESERAGQRALHGPGHVSLKHHDCRTRAKFLERVYRGLAGSQKLPDLAGLPRSVILEIDAAGGPEKWALAQTGAQERLRRIRQWMATQGK